MSWQEILIHHSAGSDTDHLDTDDIRRFHVGGRGWRDIGYHFVVERIEGTYAAIMGRPLNMAGEHSPGHNTVAIGVCLVGNFSDAPPPPEQLKCAADLVSGLAVAFRIPVGRVLRHNAVRATECPGDLFPWDAFLELVKRGI
jgi:hypothetical protein